jgi:hypothetical protein
MRCSTTEHIGRRALLKGFVGTAAGATMLNWGSLVRSEEASGKARRDQKRCILLWMNGGASQFETFDMKPGRPTGGPFRPIGTNLPGVQVCELMPKMARQMDKLCVIRSMHTSQPDHPQGIHLMHTGYAQEANVIFPEIGAVMGKYLGQENSDLPNFIKIFSNGDSGSGFLGPKHQPFSLGHSGQLPPFAQSNVNQQVEARRHRLRQMLENGRAERGPAKLAQMHHEAYDASRRLQGALGAFDVDQEWEKHRDLYGDSLFGRRCLTARRLVEAGVPFVEVGQSSYDSHADNFVWHKGLVPPMDHAWSGLLVDLEQRGLLDNTLVIWMGEFGRTPNVNNRSGRDHYIRAWTAVLAGGGVKRGLIYGETDEDGRDVKDNPVTEGDFFATIYASFGIDPTTEHLSGVRPIPIAPFGSKVVGDLLA